MIIVIKCILIIKITFKMLKIQTELIDNVSRQHSANSRRPVSEANAPNNQFDSTFPPLHHPAK